MLITAGEMHLERCLTDLRERYSREVSELVVSEPIIPFLETIINPPKFDRVNETIDINKIDRQRDLKDNNVRISSQIFRLSHFFQISTSTANKSCRFRIRAVPLPPYLLETMERHSCLVEMLADRQAKLSTKADDSLQLAFDDMLEQLGVFRKELLVAFERAWKEHQGDSSTFWSHLSLGDTLRLVEQIWAFGPQRARYNILFNCVPDYQDRPSVWDG